MRSKSLILGMVFIYACGGPEEAVDLAPTASYRPIGNSIFHVNVQVTGQDDGCGISAHQIRNRYAFVPAALNAGTIFVNGVPACAYTQNGFDVSADCCDNPQYDIRTHFDFDVSQGITGNGRTTSSILRCSWVSYALNGAAAGFDSTLPYEPPPRCDTVFNVQAKREL